MANVSPRWHVQAANNMALLLYLRQQYTEADEVLQQVRRGDWRERGINNGVGVRQ